MQAFVQAYAILGAQRASKVLGIFVRLDRRDGKPAYLRHLPRVEAYLKRCLAHPALAKLKAWYATHLPGFAELQESGQQDGGRSGDADQQGDGSGRGAGNADAAADGNPPEAAD